MRRLLMACAIVLLVGAVATGFAAHTLTRAANTKVGPPPEDIAAVTVSIRGEGDLVVAGWYVEAPPGAQASVLLLHGIQGNRSTQVDRIRLFHDAGYDVLAIDLTAHGETYYPRLTFGHIESRAAHAALAWLRARRSGSKVAVVGQSLGGAAALLGGSLLPTDAVVLEAVYADIRNATADRIEMMAGRPARILQPLLVAAASWLVGVDPSRLRPIERIGRSKAPILIIAGAVDRHTPLPDLQALFSAAPLPKEIWIVGDAGHYDFERHAPAEYRRRVLDFLVRHEVRP